MKKLAVALFIIALAAMSACQGNKRCPAYESNTDVSEQTVEIS